MTATGPGQNGPGWPAWLPAVLLLLAIRLLAPVGYLGGGGDDWFYLEAARCQLANGWCPPATHWATRWPLTAPLAGAIGLFGEGRGALMLVPALYAIATILLLGAIATRLFGRGAAMAAGLWLVLTPAFSERAFQPGVDIPELCWLLAALAAMLRAVDDHSARWAGVAGIAFGMAVMTRLTALAILPPLALVAVLFLPTRAWRLVPAAMAGALLPLLADGMVALGAGGDPFATVRLALGHTAIPSTELAPWVDRTAGPLLNLDYVRGWRRSMGIELHWTIDPIANLLADPRIGPAWLCAAAASALAWRWLPMRRALAFALAAAALQFLLLVFVLAIDPKPRMFMAITTLFAMLGGVAVAAMPRREIAAALIILLAGNLAIIEGRSHARDYARADAVAKRWQAGQPVPVATDTLSARVLTLVPGIDQLSQDAPSAGTVLILIAPRGCAERVAAMARPARLIRAAWLGSGQPPAGWATRPAGRGEQPMLCLVRVSGA